MEGKKRERGKEEDRGKKQTTEGREMGKNQALLGKMIIPKRVGGKVSVALEEL